MRSSAILAAVLASLAAATPTPGTATLADRATPARCNPSGLSPPKAPTPLPSPPAGTKALLVAIGVGTQNYSCAAHPSSSAAPTPIGALATLYDASCTAVTGQANLNNATAYAYAHPDGPAPGDGVTGMHYFATPTSPIFNLTLGQLGVAYAAKVANSSAPSNDLGDVAWLYLNAQTASGGGIASAGSVKAVYRVETQAGSPPPNCLQIGSTVNVRYAAQYWFFG